MDWTIKEMKSLGRGYMQRSYWKAWFITTIILLLSMGTTFSAILGVAQQIPYIIRDLASGVARTETLDLKALAVIITLSCGILLLNVVIRTVIALFLRNPAEVGAVTFMRKASKEEPDGMIADLAFAFDNNYINHVRTMFVADVIIFAFSLLLVVPGIIKSYEYRMVSYILSEQPEISPKEALMLSKQMMKNNKMKVFLLDLSFIPWHLLGVLTLGVLEVFYVIPWTYTTEVAVYNELRKGM